MPELKHLPTINMRGFGLNDFNQPRYRVIWAPTRMHNTGRKIIPLYSPLHRVSPIREAGGNVWVLEQWQPASATLLTAEQWERDPLYYGRPYPHRGEYYLCNEGVWRWAPSFSEVRFVIALLEAGRMRRPIENMLSIRDEVEYAEKESDRILTDRIEDRMSAWPGVEVSSARFSKGQKTARVVLSAEEAGLHTKGMRTRRSRRRFQIPVGANGARLNGAGVPVSRRSQIIVP